MIGYSCASVKDCCNVVFIRSQAMELRSDPYISDFSKSSICLLKNTCIINIINTDGILF